jgi:hypothetical protein
LYYEGRGGLDEMFAVFLCQESMLGREAKLNPNTRTLVSAFIACYYFGIAAELFCYVLRGGRV